MASMVSHSSVQAAGMQELQERLGQVQAGQYGWEEGWGGGGERRGWEEGLGGGADYSGHVCTVDETELSCACCGVNGSGCTYVRTYVGGVAVLGVHLCVF